MATDTTINATADDTKQGMTLAEVEAFIASARAAGATGNERVKMEATWRQSIKRLTVSVPTDAIPDAKHW